MKEYDLLSSSVNARTPFSFPGHSIKLRNCYIRFKTNEKSGVFLITLPRKLLHRFMTNEKSGCFLIGLAGEMLHHSYNNEDIAKSSALFQTLFFIQKEAIAS